MRSILKMVLILRACESFDFGDSRHESKQALTTRQIAESRIDSQTLRSPAGREPRRASRRTQTAHASPSRPVPHPAALPGELGAPEPGPTETASCTARVGPYLET